MHDSPTQDAFGGYKKEVLPPLIEEGEGSSSDDERVLPTPPLHFLHKMIHPSCEADEIITIIEEGDPTIYRKQERHRWSTGMILEQPLSSDENNDHLIYTSCSSSSENEKNIENSRSKKFTAVHKRKRWNTISLPFFGFLMIGLSTVFTFRTKLHSASEQMVLLANTRRRMNDQLKRFEDNVREMKRQISRMETVAVQKRNDSTATKSSSTPEQTPEKALAQASLRKMTRLQKQVESNTELAKSLKDEVQKSGRLDTQVKYGSGPYLVEIELVFPTAVDGGDWSPRTFVIELASLEIMPHSVHTFLEMVSLGLLDGCSFILNTSHALKSAPLPYNVGGGGGSSAAATPTSAAQIAQNFSKHGIAGVAFKEYSHEYPHKQYTVGFAADGSPSFYINTDDNSKINVGDPCFGRIISGFDAVKRMEASPTKNGNWLEQRIGIRSARILTKDYSSTGKMIRERRQ